MRDMASANRPLPMQVLTKAEALEFVRQRSAVFDEAGRSNPFACSAWMLHFIATIARSDWTFLVPEHLDGGRGFMLLYSEPAAPDRWLALTNYYASLYSPLISTAVSAPDRAGAVAQLVDQLVQARPRAATVNIAPLDEASPDTAALRQGLSARGWYVRQYFCFGNWYLPCAGVGFETYMKTRDSKLYNTWTRKSKKFKGTTPDGGRLEIVTDPAGVQAAMDAYQRVYSKSWKKPEPYPTFVRDWAAICADNGWLRLGLAWVGDVPIAAQFWFTMDRRAYIFKLAYDEDYSKWSAGTVLSARMFEHALDHDQVIEIDYLTGDDDYKKSWVSERRERIGLMACNPGTPRGLLAAATEYVAALRRRWLAHRRSGRSAADLGPPEVEPVVHAATRD